VRLGRLPKLRGKTVVAKKKDKGINPALEDAIAEMLKSVMQDDTASLTDKCKVVDRALNLEKIKLKITDEEWGTGFMVDDDEE